MEEIVYEIFKVMCLLIHPTNFQTSSKILHYVFTVYNKVQELALIIELNQSSDQIMKTLENIISYLFALNSFSNNQISAFILIILIIQIFILIFAIRFYFNSNNLLQTIIHQFLINYTLILQIPILLLTFSIIGTHNFCQDFCYDNKIAFVIISIINFIFCLIINIIHLYFARCEIITQDNNILRLDSSILLNAINISLIYTIIVLKSLNLANSVRLILLIIKGILYIIFSLKKLNEKIYLIIETITLCLATAFIIKLTFFETLLVILLFNGIILKLSDIVLQFFIFTKQQQNYTTVQIIEICQEQGSDLKSKFVMEIIKSNHICSRRKFETSISECLLRKMSNTSQKHKKNYSVLLYCQQISNTAPLKALIKLITVEITELYYKCTYSNLSKQLYKRTKQFQNQAHSKNFKRNSNEHSGHLDAQTAYDTNNSTNVLFKQIIETIGNKIIFWNKLINGYSEIDQLLQDSFKTTSQMIKCKSMITQRFDLINFKLKEAIYPDILTLRIIQIYYSAIYANSYLAYVIEKSIEDLLKTERFKQEEELENIQLVQNRLIVLQTSLVRRRGELINLNTKQLSQFLNQKEDDIKIIKHCTQLMPNFLILIHDKLMDNYLVNGFSKLMISGESTFYKNLNGFIEPCNINLFNFYDGQNDFILNLLLVKEQQNYETILFGVDGRILGITRQFFDDIFNEQCKSQYKQEQYNFKDQFERNSLITFYIPGIINQIEELKEQINSSYNYQLNNLKSQWIIPENHNECLQYQQLILSQYKLKQDNSNSQNLKSYKSMTYSRYSQISQNTQQDNYDEREFTAELMRQISIEKNPIIILHPNYVEQIKRIVNFQDTSISKRYEIQYTLQYKALKYKKGFYGYFQLTIKEYKPISFVQGFTGTIPTTIISTDPNYIQRSNISSQVQTSQNQLSDLKSEISDSKLEFIKEIKQMSIFFQNQNMHMDNYNYLENKSNIQSFSNSKIGFQPLKSTDRAFEIEAQGNRQQTRFLSSNLFLASQFTIQPLYIQSKQFDQQMIQDIQDVEKDMKEMNIQKSDLQDDVLIDSEDIGKIQSKSQSEKKSNILQKFKMTQRMKIQDNQEFASNPSRTSTSSTSKEALTLVQELYDNDQLITPLKRISFILFIICIGILIINIVNVLLIDNNLSDQVNQINNVRMPLNINYFYCGSVLQLWFRHLNELELLQSSPYIKQRMIDKLEVIFEYGRGMMSDTIIQVPILGASLNADNFQTKFVENNVRIFQNQPLQYFYQRMYELIEDLYRRNINCTQDCDYSDLYISGYIRQNLAGMMDFHNNLIELITNETINTQKNISGQFLQILFVEIFTILFFIAIQLKIWLNIDHISKFILLLVSRLNENQALIQIQKLTIIKKYLEEESNNQWKICNFSDIMFQYTDKKSKKINTIDKQIEKQQSGYKSSTALYSRIMKTNYINKINVIITCTIALLWTIYLMAGYLIHMEKNNNFQPSLEATLRTVKFRHNFDASAILGNFIKSDNLIPNNQMQFINQSYMIDLFIEFKDQVQPLMNEMANVVLENANQQGVQSRFDDILNNDLCLTMNSSILGFCDPSLITLQYYNADDYRALIQNGALGYVAAYIKYLSQDYDYEMTTYNYSTNSTQNIQDINSQQFNNLIIEYSTDLMIGMRAFLILLQEENTSIANQINQTIQAYYFGLGISFFIILCLISIVWVYSAQIKMSQLRQILVLIPVDLILTSNIRSQAREIHSWLY